MGWWLFGFFFLLGGEGSSSLSSSSAVLVVVGLALTVATVSSFFSLCSLVLICWGVVTLFLAAACLFFPAIRRGAGETEIKITSSSSDSFIEDSSSYKAAWSFDIGTNTGCLLTAEGRGVEAMIGIKGELLLEVGSRLICLKLFGPLTIRVEGGGIRVVEVGGVIKADGTDSADEASDGERI